MTRDPIPEVEAELAASEFSLQQHEVYRRLREHAPVYWSPTLDSWLVTTFELVDEVLTDPDRFSSVGAELEHIGKLDASVLAESPVLTDHFAAAQLNITDPPDHIRIRRAFGRSFVPREVAQYEELITTTAERLIRNARSADGDFDVITDYAESLPVEVVSEIIGVPEEYRPDIPRVTLDQRYFFGEVPPKPGWARQFAGSLADWHERLTAWIDERRQSPRGDVLTRAAIMIDEGRLTLDEALATCLHLIIAGNGTTTALIGNTVYLLLSHPEQLSLVRSDPSLMANAVEESLRYEAPLPRDRRIATTSTALGGKLVEQGERVVSVLAAANRDPAQFELPDHFDITRSFAPSQHAAFGRGIHFCLGAPVARLETRIALEVFLKAFPAATIPEGFSPEWHPITTHRGLTRLPIESTLAMS